MRELKTDILIVGGGTGAVAAAMAATSLGHNVILTEQYPWLGGQLTSQIVPPDENWWIETIGGTQRYQTFRNKVRQYYRDNYPLTAAVRNNPRLNPGGGGVSRLCHNPRVGVSVIEAMLLPLLATRQLTVLQPYKPVAADTTGDTVRAVTLINTQTSEKVHITAPYILDATELGDLLPLTGTEYVTGAESQKQTGEMHALAGEPEPENVQAFTWCFAMGLDPTPGANHVIDKPKHYDFWRAYVPDVRPDPWSGPLLSWVDCHPIDPKIHRKNYLLPGEKGADQGKGYFYYRQLQNPDFFDTPIKPHAVTCVNWPMNDYMLGNLIDKPEPEVQKHLEGSRELSRCLLYWMQTEAPNQLTGKPGFPNLYLRPDFTGTDDGLAQAPYIRESRRIKAEFTVTEAHIGSQMRWCRKEPYGTFTGRNFDQVVGPHCQSFFDSVGIGHYPIDLHPSANGTNYVDVGSVPFEIPLGALIPVRVNNLIPACKNLGVTHITNGCYRLHPVEWNIGESAGLLAAFCLKKGVSPRQVRNDKPVLREFQTLVTTQGIGLHWPWQYSPLDVRSGDY